MEIQKGNAQEDIAPEPFKDVARSEPNTMTARRATGFYTGFSQYLQTLGDLTKLHKNLETKEASAGTKNLIQWRRHLEIADVCPLLSSVSRQEILRNLVIGNVLNLNLGLLIEKS